MRVSTMPRVVRLSLLAVAAAAPYVLAACSDPLAPATRAPRSAVATSDSSGRTTGGTIPWFDSESTTSVGGTIPWF